MRIKVSPDVMFADLGNEAILLEMEQGAYFGLDSVGQRFWQLINAGVDFERALDELLGVYDVDRETLRTDLLHLVAEMQEARLVRVED